MRFRATLIIVLSSAIFLQGFSLDMRINLYHPSIIKSVSFTCNRGEYVYYDHQGNKKLLGEGDVLFLKIFNMGAWCRDKQGNWMRLDKFLLKAGSENCIIRVKPMDPVLQGREYYGDLEAEVKFNGIRLVNIIDIEKYLMGVVETEAGITAPLDFYKVQAVIARTFAVSYFNRHLEEGYNLCDNVHCQAYKGRHFWNEDVEIGVEVTRGMILTDQDSIPIIAVFHSNSGGETQAADKVWLKVQPYLKPVLDPFSKGQPNSTWTREITLEDWIAYLAKHGITLPEKVDPEIFDARQVHRAKYYYINNDSIEYSRIREDWNLRSAWFSVHRGGDVLILSGKGYGHGVGLSQEGAINMAAKGYHFIEILNFYYDNIQVMDYRELETAGKINLCEDHLIEP